MTTRCHAIVFFSDTEKKARTSSSSFFSQTQRRRQWQQVAITFFITHKKTTKKNQEKGKEGAYLQALALPYHFWFLFLPSHFCTSVSSAFSWHLFIFKQKKKTHTHKEKKTIKKKIYVKKRSLPSSSHSAFSLLTPIFTFLLLHFCFKCFLLASFFSQAKEKKKNTKKKKP
jgi:hypothetical protein